MPFDMLGNKLQEEDLVCVKVTEMVVGRIVKLSEPSSIGTADNKMGYPGRMLVLVEVHRAFEKADARLDLIKVVEPDVLKPKVN